MAGILRALTQVLHIWWTKDRIRVARNEGKLFRIGVGDRLLIEDKVFCVVARHDSSNAEVAQVVYSLVEPRTESLAEEHSEEHSDQNQAWSLRFTMHSDNASLCHSSREFEIESDRVHVLEPKSIAGC
jgi:hypothetical protein